MPDVERPPAPPECAEDGRPRGTPTLTDLIRGRVPPARAAAPTAAPAQSLTRVLRAQPPPAARAAEAAPAAATPEQADPARVPAAEQTALEDLRAAHELFQQAVGTMEEALGAVRAQRPLPIDRLERVLAALLQSLRRGDALLVPFFGGGQAPGGRAPAAVSLCVLSVKIGMHLEYPAEALRALGLTALLHCALAQGPRRADPAQVMRALNPEYSEVAERALQVAERCDGSGPRGLRGEAIHEHAQIVGVAELYLGLSQELPTRTRLGPPMALKRILQRERSAFAEPVLKALIRVLSTVPVGCLVRLNSGEIGRVVARNDGYPLRPVVSILGRRGQRLPEPKVIDLSQNPLLHFQEFVSEAALDADAEGAGR